MRVLLVSPVGVLGGAEQVFLGLAKYLPRWGVEPMLACLRPGPLVEQARRQGLTTHVFRDHRFHQFGRVSQGVLWLTHLAREAKVDLLHSNYAAHLYGAPAGLLARVPELWHIHDYPYRRDALGHVIERLPSRYVLFTTRRVKSGFPALQRRPHTVIHPACVEADRLRAIPHVREIRERLQLPPGPLFLTVARLQEHKGHRYLIDAVPSVLRSHPEAVFAVAGKASGAQQERYRDELMAQCSRLGVAERVRFLGYVAEPDLVSLYREAAALVHPATSEGFGLILLEAMALGAPIIAASADGPSELILPDRTGLLVATRDSAALAQAVVRLLESPALAETLRRQGQKFASRFQVDTMVEQTVAVYRELLGRRKGVEHVVQLAQDRPADG